MIRGFYPGEKNLPVSLNLTAKEFKQGELFIHEMIRMEGGKEFRILFFFPSFASEGNLPEKEECNFEADMNRVSSINRIDRWRIVSFSADSVSG